MEKIRKGVENKWQSWKSILKIGLLKPFFGAVDHECWVAIDSMCATSWAHAPELDSNSTSTRDRPEIVTTASFTGPAPRGSEFLCFLHFIFGIARGDFKPQENHCFLLLFGLGQENQWFYCVVRA